MHPNSNLISALIFSVTTMSTDEWVALITALGMVFSSVIGILMQYLRWRQERAERVSKMSIELRTKELEFDRMQLENDRISLELKKENHKFEFNKARKDEDGNEHG